MALNTWQVSASTKLSNGDVVTSAVATVRLAADDIESAYDELAMNDRLHVIDINQGSEAWVDDKCLLNLADIDGSRSAPYVDPDGANSGLGYAEGYIGEFYFNLVRDEDADREET